MVSLLLPAILQGSYFYLHFTEDEHKCFSEHQNYLEGLLTQISGLASEFLIQ